MTNIYIADYGNHTIRRITQSGTDWVVSTFAGQAGGPGTNDGMGTNARFNGPIGITVDSNSTVFVVDSGNNTIRRINSAGVVTTIAGQAGVIGYGSADGMGAAAQFEFLTGIAVDRSGNLYVTDEGNQTIRKLIPTSTGWTVNTIGGLVQNIGSADGTGSAARFQYPFGVAVDSEGNVYVADSQNNTIRKGAFTQHGPTNAVPYSPAGMNGNLVVALTPPSASGQWRLPWELRWRNSGEVVTNLAAGTYPIEFRNVPGWLVIPFSSPVNVTNNGTTYITNQYYPTIGSLDTNTSGTLTVNIGPSPPPGVGWHFLGDTTPAFPPGYPPGFSTNLQAGTYLIEFAPVANYSKPPSFSVPISAGKPTVISVNYTLASSKPDQVLFPFPVPPGNIGDLADYPFGFNGQLQTDIGYGSGVVVQTNVVLTAAHLVFNDQTVSYVGQAYWYLQQEAGVYSPQPLTARGWYVLSGYASHRTNDLGHGYGPDQSSAASRNEDVAALYFPWSAPQVPWNGYGGYLPSDVSPNPWLTGNSLKMLVGYPVDGSFFGDTSITNGVMYQTDPQPYPLSLAPDQVNNQRVYTASWFLSYPGSSGGPLYVQLNGYYYPAGVYLGTLYNGSTYQSVVRAIDSDVVNLITNAVTIGSGGTNHTGGGVITFVPNQAISANNQAYVQVLLGPPSAIQAGAGWRLSGDPSYGNAPSYMRAITTNGATIEFASLPGWISPCSQTNQLTPGIITVISNAFYTVTNPVLVAKPGQGLGITGTTGTTYRLEYRTSLASGGWQPLVTNTLTDGLNLLLPWPPTNGPAAFYRAVWLQF
jgi:hypothetical protein